MKKIIMKKIAIFSVAAMTALSLAACTPTTEKNSKTEQTAPVNAETGGASDKVPDPNVAPMDIISVYYQNEAKTGLDKEMDAVEKLTEQALVDKLIEYGLLPEGTKATSFKVEGKVGTLDLSALPQMEEAEASLTKIAIGNTFIENFELEELKLLVGGKEYEDLGFELEYKELK